MLDEFGREVPDPQPLEWPSQLRRPLSLQEEIKRFVRSELSQSAAAAGFESFEEADDFNVPDDEGDLLSGYQMTTMQEDAPVNKVLVGDDLEGLPPAPPPAEQPVAAPNVAPPQSAVSASDPPPTVPKP